MTHFWVALMAGFVGAIVGVTMVILAPTMITVLKLPPTTKFDNLVSTAMEMWYFFFSFLWTSPALAYAEDKRRRLPKTIILIRHGQSEANADKSKWKNIPDNLLGLTDKGRQQAKAAGERVENLFLSLENESSDKKKNCSYARIHLVVSPFERSLQTASCMRPAFEHRIVRTDIESRIREQEAGNLQDDTKQVQHERQEQRNKVGRFWYRFREGESGADVLDRAKSWWYESVLTVNERVGLEPIDAMVVVTHGLTMRFILMQLFGWSPTTFHSVWNVHNCGVYVLQKDLSKPGPSPYVLDKEHGDMPRSSIDVVVKLKKAKQGNHDTPGGMVQKTEEVPFKLEDYLMIPPPRTTQIEIVKQMLASQYPKEIRSPSDIVSILLMPFIVEDDDIILGRSGVAESNNSDFQRDNRGADTKQHHRRTSSSRLLEHCQFSCTSARSIASCESDDRLCNCNLAVRQT